jgi:hypothetical protein
MLGLIDIMQKRRIVLEQKEPLFRCQLLFKPHPLFMLFAQAAVEDLAVDHDEAAAAMVERIKVLAKMLSIDRKEARIDHHRRRPGNRLVAHVMIARNEIEGHLQIFEESVEAPCCRCVAGL